MKKLINLIKSVFSKEKSVSPQIEGIHIIKLTEEDFEGKFMNIHDCPIARAVKRQFPHFADVSVGGVLFHFWHKSKLYEGSISYNDSVKAMRRAKDEHISRRQTGNFEFKTEIKLLRN